MKKHNVLCLLCALAFAVSAEAAMEDEDFVKLCEKGTAQELRQALKDGANAQARKYLDYGSIPVLTLAAEAGNLQVVQVLLDAHRDIGASVDEADVDIGETALMAAASGGHAAVVEALLAAGASTELKDIDGHNALWHAENAGENVSKEDKEHCIKLLQDAAEKLAASTLVEVRYALAVDGKTPVTLTAMKPITLSFYELNYENDGPQLGKNKETIRLDAGKTHTFSHEQPFDMPVQAVCVEAEQIERKCWFVQDDESDDGNRFIMQAGFVLKN
ncbi:MAG: ankyrin repeat domain-containing protein [Cardiobacteriaceae bacterium]|nr:ankyrin repeat domain-containing protein [Cardiobacteriaceae bacterium]